jgi:hypothetical protein
MSFSILIEEKDVFIVGHYWVFSNRIDCVRCLISKVRNSDITNQVIYDILLLLCHFRGLFDALNYSI